jgi:tetratricopeptide (TPR) repeat protein
MKRLRWTMLPLFLMTLFAGGSSARADDAAAAFALARNRQSIAEYAEAAELIESAVKRYAKSEEAPEALTDAFIFRLALGEIDRAQQDFDLFSKNYGAKRPAELAKMIFALGLDHLEKGRYKDAAALLQKQMSVIDSRGAMDTRILAHALLGRVLVQQGHSAKAADEYKVVVSAWSVPEKAIAQLDALGGTEDEQLRRLGKVLTAVGEAMFFFAELRRAEADAIRFPEYMGRGTKDSVVEFIRTKVHDWMKQKRTAVEAAENEYQKILRIQPVPPPRWVIASASRVGILWEGFASDFRRAPMPKEWASGKLIPGTAMLYTELARMYRELISSALEPFMARAKTAFRVCADYSLKFQHVDEQSKACVTWLEKNHPKQWIPVVEFMPAPKHDALPISTRLILPNP